MRMSLVSHLCRNCCLTRRALAPVKSTAADRANIAISDRLDLIGDLVIEAILEAVLVTTGLIAVAR